MSCERIIPSQAPALAHGEIHIWHIDLAQPAAAVAALRVFLPREELERAARFHFAVHRDRFVVAHAALRNILGSYLNAAPESLEFLAGSHGKPDLAPHNNSLGLTFNLSHSGDRALVGIARQTQLGIDIEQIRADFAGCEIAERFFSPREVAALRAVPSPLQVEAFFECWTRKEAFIKACGQGLSFGLDNFDVAFGPGEAPALLDVKPDPREASHWKLYNIAPTPQGYKAALVVEGADHVLQQCEWVNPLAPE
jgi:4'-phosphopantetheinyl transferase